MPYTKFKVVLMDEATAFLESLPLKVYKKIDYNIGKVAGGIMDKDLFKKLEDTEIWEFRTLIQWHTIPIVGILGHGSRNVGYCYTRFRKEDPEDTTKGNR